MKTPGNRTVDIDRLLVEDRELIRQVRLEREKGLVVLARGELGLRRIERALDRMTKQLR